MGHPSDSTDSPEPIDEPVVRFGPVALRNGQSADDLSWQSAHPNGNGCATGGRAQMRYSLLKRERRRTYLPIAPPVTRVCNLRPRERARETGSAIGQWVRYFRGNLARRCLREQVRYQGQFVSVVRFFSGTRLDDGSGSR